MSVTYTDNTLNTTTETADFVPAYARGTRRKKPVRTWMILAPIGAVALIGTGAVMMLQGGEAPAPLAEPAPIVAEPLAVQPLTPAAPLESSTLLDNASASIAPPTPAPVVTERRAAPAPAPAVQRRQAAPVERRAEPAPVASRVETPPAPTGPQPYTATPSLNAAPPAPTTAPVTPAPAIQTAPLN